MVNKCITWCADKLFIMTVLHNLTSDTAKSQTMGLFSIHLVLWSVSYIGFIVQIRSFTSWFFIVAPQSLVLSSNLWSVCDISYSTSMCQKLHQLQPRRNLPRVRWWIRQSHLPETIQNSMCSLQQTRKKDCFESRYVQMPSRWARLFQLVSGFVLSKLIIILIMVIILRYWRIERKSSPPSGAFWTRTECQRGKAKEALAYAATRACYITGSPSSSCEMIILRNNSHGGIIFLYNLYGNVYDRFKELKSILAQRITYYLTAYFD